jgi:hypothetical protein
MGQEVVKSSLQCPMCNSEISHHILQLNLPRKEFDKYEESLTNASAFISERQLPRKKIIEMEKVSQIDVPSKKIVEKEKVMNSFEKGPVQTNFLEQNKKFSNDVRLANYIWFERDQDFYASDDEEIKTYNPFLIEPVFEKQEIKPSFERKEKSAFEPKEIIGNCRKCHQTLKENHLKIVIDKQDIYLICNNWDGSEYNIFCILCNDLAIGSPESALSHFKKNHWKMKTEDALKNSSMCIFPYLENIPLNLSERRPNKNKFRGYVCFYCKSGFDSHKTITLNKNKVTPVCGNKLPIVLFCTTCLIPIAYDTYHEHREYNHKEEK